MGRCGLVPTRASEAGAGQQPSEGYDTFNRSFSKTDQP